MKPLGHGPQFAAPVAELGAQTVWESQPPLFVAHAFTISVVLIINKIIFGDYQYIPWFRFRDSPQDMGRMF